MHTSLEGKEAEAAGLSGTCHLIQGHTYSGSAFPSPPKGPGRSTAQVQGELGKG